MESNNNNNENETQEDGSIWASYSDMFTSMAIIFLVMFVFALIKAGVSTITIVKNKQEFKEKIEGEISEKQKIEAQKKINTFEQSVTDIEKYEQLVNKKIEELNTFTNRLKDNKSVLKKMVQESKENAVAMENLSSKLKTQNDLLVKKDVINSDLNKNLNLKIKEIQKLTDIQDSLKNKLELENIKYVKSLKDYQNKITQTENVLKAQKVNNTELEKVIKNKQQEIAALIYNLENTEMIFNQRVDSMEKLNKVKQTTISDLNKKLQQSKLEHTKLRNVISDLSRAKDSLENQVNGHIKNISSLKNTIAKNQNHIKSLEGQNQSLNTQIAHNNETITGLKNEIEGHNSKISSLQGQLSANRDSIDTLKGENSQLQSQLQSSMGNNRSLSSKLSSSHSELSKLHASLEGSNSKIGELQGQIGSLTKDIFNYKNMVAKSKYAEKSCQKAKHKIATMRTNLRNNIAGRLAYRFKDANLDVQVNPNNGNITLGISKKFLFKRNSYELKNEDKNRLSKIIPIYAETLLGDNDIKDKIYSFNITGHASPTYDRKCVEFEKINSKAYEYNLNLSLKRAEAITNYIFSENSFNFDQKLYMRSLVNSVGKSFSEPIERPIGRALASINEDQQTCGNYLIKDSQRVELSFTLKDEIKIDPQLLK